MINAFLPGPASIKDKRATVSMDFCAYARFTGETFKFYAICSPSFSSVTTTDSPTSSMQDSGYASSFNQSPIVSGLNMWNHATSPSASFLGSSQSSTSAAHSSSPRKSAVSASRASTHDFSHLPGMKIMTRDGLDITNSASRGCKTKEQRDHAHLMRIIKACDACRKRKIRCDPSHKKRSASQAQPQPQPEMRSPKKAKKVTVEKPVEVSVSSPDSAFSAASMQMLASANEPPISHFCLDESWEQFVQFEQDSAAIPGPEYDFFFDPEGYFTPSTGTSISPAQPFTPVASRPSPAVYPPEGFRPDVQSQEPTLPYLNPLSSGSNYVDFNLFSPASSFVDEEPQEVRSRKHSPCPAAAGSDTSAASHMPTLQLSNAYHSNIPGIPNPAAPQLHYSEFLNLGDLSPRRPATPATELPAESASGVRGACHPGGHGHGGLAMPDIHEARLQDPIRLGSAAAAELIDLPLQIWPLSDHDPGQSRTSSILTRNSRPEDGSATTLHYTPSAPMVLPGTVGTAGTVVCPLCWRRNVRQLTRIQILSDQGVQRISALLAPSSIGPEHRPRRHLESPGLPSSTIAAPSAPQASCDLPMIPSDEGRDKLAGEAASSSSAGAVSAISSGASGLGIVRAQAPSTSSHIPTQLRQTLCRQTIALPGRSVSDDTTAAASPSPTQLFLERLVTELSQQITFPGAILATERQETHSPLATVATVLPQGTAEASAITANGIQRSLASASTSSLLSSSAISVATIILATILLWILSSRKALELLASFAGYVVWLASVPSSWERLLPPPRRAASNCLVLATMFSA